VHRRRLEVLLVDRLLVEIQHHLLVGFLLRAGGLDGRRRERKRGGEHQRDPCHDRLLCPGADPRSAIDPDLVADAPHVHLVVESRDGRVLRNQ
jgi:hypothetical protein